VRIATLVRSFSDLARIHKHCALRAWPQWNAADARAVHDGISCDLWVRISDKTFQRMLTNVASFFMAIGTTIRTDSSPIATEAFSRVNRRAMILPRQYHSLRASSDEKN
jgi:hypothetical protein